MSGSGPSATSAADRAASLFRLLHGSSAEGVWSAPGRVNLIGEHTDYNDGLVLPFALPHRTAVAARARSDGMLSVATMGTDGKPSRAAPIAVARLHPGAVTGWAAYPCGVAWALNLHGIGEVAQGADLAIASDVPTGAGLSSSAALECAVALALLGLVGTPWQQRSRYELARVAQQAENDFVGAPTGVLDQTASLCCTRGHVLFLDVRSGEMEQVPFDPTVECLCLLVIDTRAAHEHSESGYGERRHGCERAAQVLGVPTLRDVPVTELDAALGRLGAGLRPLVRHVVTENERVRDVVALLRQGHPDRIGRLLTHSHESLRDDYRVSAPELDTAVDSALASGALGARMTGGGFGGSALALVPEPRVSEVSAMVGRAFADRGFAEPLTFPAAPSVGAGRDW